MIQGKGRIRTDIFGQGQVWLKLVLQQKMLCTVVLRRKACRADLGFIEKDGELSRQEGAVRIITQTVTDVLPTTSLTKYEKISTMAVCWS